MGRVELLAVGESGPGGARMAEWDGGMFRRAEGGGRMAQPVGEHSGSRALRAAQSSNTSGSDWLNTKSGAGSTAVGSTGWGRCVWEVGGDYGPHHARDFGGTAVMDEGYRPPSESRQLWSAGWLGSDSRKRIRSEWNCSVFSNWGLCPTPG